MGHTKEESVDTSLDHRQQNQLISSQEMTYSKCFLIANYGLNKKKLSFYFLRLDLLNFLFRSGVSTDTRYTSILFSIIATRSVHLILLDLITIIVFNEQCWSCNSSLCSLFSTLLSRPSQNQLCSSVLFSHWPSAYVLPSAWSTEFRTRPKQQQKYYNSTYLNICIFGQQRRQKILGRVVGSMSEFSLVCCRVMSVQRIVLNCQFGGGSYWHLGSGNVKFSWYATKPVNVKFGVITAGFMKMLMVWSVTLQWWTNTSSTASHRRRRE